MIVDAQLHEPGPRLEWPVDADVRNRAMLEILLAWMEAAGVDGALLQSGDRELGAFATEQLPDVFGFVPGFSHAADAELPDYDAEIDRLAEQPGVKGVRLIVGFPLDGTNARRFESGAFDAVFAACERNRLPLFLFATRWLHLLPPAIERHPDLPIVIDHLGLPQPPMDEAESPPWKSLDSLLAFAEYPNVAVKLCGAPALSTQGSPFADVWPRLRRIVDAFGADRLMWASDQSRFYGRIGFKLTLPHAVEGYPGKHTYAESVGLYRDTDLLTDAEKDAILGGTVRRLLGWPEGVAR